MKKGDINKTMAKGDKQKLITDIVATVLNEPAQTKETFDCFRDFLPEINRIQPTLRINEFEVSNNHTNNKDACMIIEKLIKTKIE